MASEIQYMLSRGVHASMRLNLQHYLIQHTIGYLTHPSITHDDQRRLKIADIGTGTGIWLLDLAQNLPDSAQLDGFDINDAQWPTEENRPANVGLHILDCVDHEIPHHLHGCYDVVHLRLFVGVVNKGDPMMLFHNALKMLRPGGYLQWVEMDPRQTEAKHYAGKSASSCQAVVDMMNSVKDQKWIQRLKEIFIDAGMEAVEYEFHREQTWQRRMGSDLTCALAFDIAATVFDATSEKGQQLSKTVSNAFEEVKNGAVISQPLVVVVGRKPLRD